MSRAASEFGAIVMGVPSIRGSDVARPMGEALPPAFRVVGAYKANRAATIDGACCRRLSAYFH
jgi:hypothetical protein